MTDGARGPPCPPSAALALQLRRGMRERFRHFAHAASEAAGTVWAFFAAAAMVVLWAASGPLTRYSEAWQLTINTATTIITFLMVFLIQSTQSRDSRSMELKLDELIRAVKGARTSLMRLEELSDEELEALRREFDTIRERLAGRRAAAPLPAGPEAAGERRRPAPSPRTRPST